MDAVLVEIRQPSKEFIDELRARPAAPHPGHGHRARPYGEPRVVTPALAQCQMQSRAA